MVNGKLFEHRPIKELMAIVRQDFRQLDDEGLIDEGTIIKVVMACNDRLGIPLREIKEVCIQVEDFKANLPKNFEKLYYVAAVTASNSMMVKMADPFDNKFDRDVIYKAELDRESLGCVENYQVTILKPHSPIKCFVGGFTTLDVDPSSFTRCHVSCPNMKKKGKYTVSIDTDHIHTGFRCGELYMMYLGTMEDEDGNILFPFHPLITPYYEWSVKEKILMDAVFNSDGNYGDRLKLAQQERVKAWLDAFSITMDKGYGEYTDHQRKKELGWYNQWFKYFQ